MKEPKHYLSIYDDIEVVGDGDNLRAQFIHTDSYEGRGSTDAEAIAELARELVQELTHLKEKLPVTEDGKIVVPLRDPIWINPDEPAGWPHGEQLHGSFDDNDNYVPPEPMCIGSWAYYGDHLWVRVGPDEGDHWFGKFYSTYDDALAARKDGQT